MKYYIILVIELGFNLAGVSVEQFTSQIFVVHQTRKFIQDPHLVHFHEFSETEHMQDSCIPVKNQHLSRPVPDLFQVHLTRELWHIVPGTPEPST